MEYQHMSICCSAYFVIKIIFEEKRIKIQDFQRKVAEHSFEK